MSMNNKLPTSVQKAVKSIDYTSPLPLYYQLYSCLTKVIVEKKIAPGDFFATEALLQKEAEMSRSTIQKAINKMVNEKYLTRITGKGTFVSIFIPKQFVSLPNLKSMTEELEERGMTPGSIVLSVSEVIPTKKIANHLNIDISKKILYVERIRTGNNLPVLYLQSYLTIPLDNINNYKELNSLYNLVKSHGINIGSAKHIISATNISSNIAKLLGVKA